MCACEHRARPFLAGSAWGHPLLRRACVALVVSLAQEVAVCRAPNLRSERYLSRARVLLLRRHHVLHRLRMIQGAALLRR